MKRRSQTFGAALAVIVFSVAQVSHADAPRYTVEFLGSTLLVVDLNDNGWAIGQMISGSIVSWVATPEGGYTLLPSLAGATDAQARDINNAGVIVGSSGGMPVVWDHVGGVYGAPTALPPLPGYGAGVATAINDLGDIVGLSNAGFQRPTLFTAAGGPLDLVPLGFGAAPAVINNMRQVCGGGMILDLNSEELTDLGVPDGPPSFIFTLGTDINDAGQVCAQGVLATSLPDDRLPARWSPGTGWDVLMSLPTPYASATSINELGDCGLAYVKAVHMEGAGLVAPADVLAPTETVWAFGNTFAIENAVIVNNHRQLLTIGWNSDLGVSGAVLLTPTNRHGDVDGDGSVALADLAYVLAQWGTADPAADCSADGVVGLSDLAIVLGNYGG
jgi:hypothetical protein